MRRTTALRRASTALAIVALIVGSLAGTAAAGGGRGGGGGGSCRKSCPTTTSTTAAMETTTTAPTTTTTTIPPTTTTTAADGDPGGTAGDTVIVDPSAQGMLDPLLRTRLVEVPGAVGVLFQDSATQAPSLWFRSTTDRSARIVDLPTDASAGWTYAAAAMTSATDLWIAGGNGPIVLRHYALSGSPLPSSATLVERRTFGTPDSRPGDLLALDSGGLVLAWHQQGSDGPQGQHLVHRSAAGGWSELPALTFMPTHYSDQVLEQHPSDGSVWLFSNPDMWGAVGAVHLTESASGLHLDWTDGTYLDDVDHGLAGPDPENPDLAVAVDHASGSIALAYQSGDRQTVGPPGSTRIVSRIAIARIPPSGPPRFDATEVRGERVADVGLLVGVDTTTVTYREVDEVTGQLRGIHMTQRSSAGWSAPVALANGSIQHVAYAPDHPVVVGLADDWSIHVLDV